MGHLCATAELHGPLRAAPGPRYLYTHVNNTNRLAGAGVTPSPELVAAIARVAVDGESLTL